MVTFHKASLDDLQGILAVMKDVNYVQFFKEPYEEDLKRYMDKYAFFIAKEDGKIVGYVIYGEVEDRFDEVPIELKKGYVASWGVGVLREFQGRNIAPRLKDFAHQELKKQGILGIYIDVGEDNPASLRLQEKLGFSLLCKYPSRHRIDGVKNCLFEKELV